MLSRRTVLVGLLALGVLGLLPLVAVVSPPQQESTTFHIGTRLVEIDVVVRGHRVWPPGVKASLDYIFDSGPPFGPPGPSIQGLTKEDFALFDDGKPQQISLFRAGPSSEIQTMPLPPGAVSNRGGARNGATVVLIDFLNTGWGLSEYARLGMTNFLRSLTEADSQVAVYSLGKELHVLQDFGEDPRKLIADFAKMDQSDGNASPALVDAFKDYGDPPTAPVSAWDAHAPMTMNALKGIVQHLAGMPGRKSLVWPMIPLRVGTFVSQDGSQSRSGYGGIPTKQVTDLLIKSNIVLYPVVMRSAANGAQQHAAEVLAEATGGRAFFDALDIPFALRAAQEDAQSSYVLGYYPAEEMLDGKHHNISVKLANAKLADAYEFHYRTGYEATKIAAAPAPPSLAELFNDPLQATGVGLVGRATPDAQRPGLYNVELRVDLHDIHLDRKDGVFTGAFDVSLPNPAGARAVQTRSVTISLPEAQLTEALEKGGTFRFSGIQPQSGEIRVAVRDRATSIGGSLRIPVQTPAVK